VFVRRNAFPAPLPLVNPDAGRRTDGAPEVDPMAEKDSKDRDDKDSPSKPNEPKGSLFATAPGGSSLSIYKLGQGYWTRLITGLAAAGLIAMFVYQIFFNVRFYLTEALINPDRARPAAASLSFNIAAGSAAGLFLLLGFLAWRLMNSPRGAEFLITTDSEMRKVNWATRKELFGSTRVVIIFLFATAIFLFVADIFFGSFFYQIGVRQTDPFR
jgi:preprotein translocase subunit SecE